MWIMKSIYKKDYLRTTQNIKLSLQLLRQKQQRFFTSEESFIFIENSYLYNHSDTAGWDCFNQKAGLVIGLLSLPPLARPPTPGGAPVTVLLGLMR